MADANKSDDKNNVKIFNSVSKLVDTLREKLESKTINVEDLFMMKDLKEIDELKILCSSEDPVLSLTACQGLVSLVQSNSVPLKCAFIILQSICVRKVSGISSAVLNLLVLDLIAQLQGGHKFKNPLPSWKMHPLCKLLIQNPNSWRDIFNRMASICYHHNKLVSDHAIELLKPLFKFFLMESANIFSETCRHQIWKLLIEKGVDSEKEFIFQILSSKYFDCESRDPLEIFSDVSVLCRTTKGDKNLENALIPLVTSLVHDALQFCYDPSSILSYLKVLLNSPDSLAHTVVLIMLSQSVTICPAVFLHQLLDFCEWLVNKGHCSTESIWMLVVATLSWLNCVSPILAPAHHSIHNILTVAQTTVSSSNTTHSLIENPYLSCIVSRNWKISSAIQLARLCESLRAEEDGYIKWLSNIPTCTISEVYLLIGALMIGRYEINIRLKTIDIIQKAPPFFASSNLTLILYQLGREKEPEGQLALLRALTSTAVDKSNISSIIFTLKTLQRSNEPNLQILAVDLFTKLWDIEERCFTLLLAALTDDKVEFTDAKFSRQMDIACAAGFRHICEKKPEKHGKELVKPIQNLLIKCQGTKGAVASSFLIQALASLVKARVLSASSTWKQLYPLTEDMQSAVCGSFCELIEACLECNCDEVLNSMCGWLWKLISTCKATFVINSALRAMKKFSVDCMKLRLVPSIYRRNVLLPAKYAKNSATADRRPEDVLDFIPGSVWADFLQNVRNECNDAACELLAYWLQVELMRYRSGVYNIQFGEPQNYEKLPLYSICRGLVDHLRRTSNSLTPESDVKVCKMIFKVLCINRPKPLPPINWNFLLPYIEHPEVKTQALSLAAKEAKGSLSARACIETYINDEFYNEERDLFLYSILTDLARGVPPKTLQNLVGRTLREAFLKKDDESVKLYLGYIEKTLEETDIHEANRTMFSQNVKVIWEDLTLQSCVFNDVLQCAVNLPLNHVETMSSVTVMWEITPERLQKAIKLRCKMALAENSETPFTWLNECIESVASQITEQKLLLTEIEDVLQQKFGHETAWPWLEELIAQMLQTVSNKEPGADFMFSVFVLAVDYISNFSSLFNKRCQKERHLRFPHAFFTLLSKVKADQAKIVEQMNYLLKKNSLSKENTTTIQYVISVIS